MSFRKYVQQHGEGRILASHRADQDYYRGPIVRVEDEGFFYFESEEHFVEEYESAISAIGPFPANEVILRNRIQRYRLDIDVPVLAGQDAEKLLGRVDDLVEMLIGCVCDVYNRTYYAEQPIGRDDFHILDSHGPEKISYHVLAPLYLRNGSACLRFNEEVQLKAEIAGHSHLDRVDWGVIKGGLANFRLPLAIKRGASHRQKTFSVDNGYHWSDALIGYYGDGEPLHMIDEATAPIKTYSESRMASRGKTIAVIDLLKKHLASTVPNCDFDATWSLLNESDRAVYFERKKPSHCEICRRRHENDNTMFATISNAGNVSLMCRRKRDVQVSVGTVTADSIRITMQDRIALMIASFEDENARPLSAHRRTIWAELARQKYAPHQMFQHAHPDLIDFPIVRTLYVRAPMKMGKTAKVLELMARTEPQSVLYVSFRQTFSAAIVVRLNEGLAASNIQFTSYLDIADAHIHADVYPYLVVQVESLMRLDMHAFDLIVLDESESIFGQMTSPFVRNPSASYAMFECLLRAAKQVIAMDANLGERTLKLIDAARPAEVPGGVYIVGQSMNQRFYYENSWKNCSDQRMIVMRSASQIYTQLSADVRAGRRCFVATNSIDEARCLMTALTNDFTVADLTAGRDNPEGEGVIKVALYTSETSPAVRSEHFRDVNRWWATADVLIYTPTVTAGVSFDVAHFDVGFGIFNSNSCDVETCRQMLGRIRNIRSNITYLHLNVFEMRMPTSHAAVGRLLLNMNSVRDGGILPHNMTPPTTAKVINGVPTLERENFFELTVSNIIHANHSRNSFHKRFFEQVLDTGVTLSFVDDDDDAIDGYNRSALRQQARNLKVRAIVDAPALEYNQYVEVMNARQGIYRGTLSIDAAMMAAADKRHLMIVYDVPEVRLDVPFVDFFNSSRVMSVFKNIADFRVALRWEEAGPPVQTLQVCNENIDRRHSGHERTNHSACRNLAVLMLTSCELTQLGEPYYVEDDVWKDVLLAIEAAVQIKMRSNINAWDVIAGHFNLRGKRTPTGVVVEALKDYFGIMVHISGSGKKRKYQFGYPNRIIMQVIESTLVIEPVE